MKYISPEMSTKFMPAPETDQNIPASGQVLNTLRGRIRSGTYGLGEQMAPEIDLAREFGVSRGTVRKAMRILERERLIFRHRGRGTFVADATHAPTHGGKTKTLAMMVYSPTYAFDRTLQSAALAAGNRGYIIASGCNITDNEEAALTNTFVKQSVCGVILSPYQQRSHTHYQELIAGGIPVVLIDSIMLNYPEDAVLIDNQAGMRIGVQHLAAVGRKRIAYMAHNRPDNIPNQPGRRIGYLNACAELRLPTRPEWILECDDNEFRDPLVRMLQADDRPDAFVAYNDLWAIRVMRTARELGLRVPEDISVVGFDNSSLASEYDVPLTTIEPDHHEMGVAAVEMLLDKIESPRQRPVRTLLLYPQLIVRQSTSAVV